MPGSTAGTVNSCVSMTGSLATPALAPTSIAMSAPSGYQARVHGRSAALSMSRPSPTLMLPRLAGGTENR